jgi:hypothetical protein
VAARLDSRKFRPTTVDVRSAGANLVDAFRVVLTPSGSLVTEAKGRIATVAR